MSKKIAKNDPFLDPQKDPKKGPKTTPFLDPKNGPKTAQIDQATIRVQFIVELYNI